MQIYKRVVLIILDGWGYSEVKENNAIAEANTPFFDELWQKYSPTLLECSGLAVGLPDGQMGNSEIGHLTIGAGAVIDTDLVRINKSIENGEFAKNPAFQKLFAHIKKHDSVLHIEGLIGPGGIHSHSEHLFAFLRSAKQAGITKIAIDVFTDGRDTAPQSAVNYIKELEDVIEEVGVGFIATASGRFYAMDRDNNWDRLEKAEQAIFKCVGNVCRNRKPSEVLTELYKEGILDEHLEPIVFLDDSRDVYPVSDNDGVFFFNYRADRARMLSKRIVEEAKHKNLCFVTMTEYDQALDCLVAFPPSSPKTTLAKEISSDGLTQAHIAETEKFAHATYFLNGGVEKPHPNEEHILIDSRKDVMTHDLAPEMRAKEIADKAIEQIKNGTNFIFINFANPDMIGHTANHDALIIALETVDRELKRVVEATLENGGVVFVTADHGNAELNIDSESGEKHTAHTGNLVPAILTDEDLEVLQGGLKDIAPTVLELLGIKKPQGMTGKSLIDEGLI